ncbi:glycoside hydrolase family 113 [Aquimarina pacifica]|uniref:glycoside hydrolase family 113 n=1 Tax=Aquimarina pacifica TaxID=1296415 RepID=UPI00046F3CAE|nr:glycoside hydrolase [Aquimarina pacifica]
MRTLFVMVFCVFCSCFGQTNKINGISFVGSPQEIAKTHIDHVVDVNAKWAAVMPFGYIKSLKTPSVVFDIQGQWWGERREGAKKTVSLLQDQGICVMLKPQIWVWKGEFTGNIAMDSEADWMQFEKTYENFMLVYAELASEMNIEMLCIGTELHSFVQERSKFWDQLISKIKRVYKGAITYAENWDQFDKVPFWDQLDYIGIDAYFPISSSRTPSVEELQKGWQTHKTKIKTLQQKIKNPILFTEYGYRSVHFTAKLPWDTNEFDGSVNLQAQTNALTALYTEFWKEPWFAGGFLWKWFHNHNAVGGDQDNRFTIQNKPAENVIKTFYAQE